MRKLRILRTPFLALILVVISPTVTTANVVIPKDLGDQPIYGAVIQESQIFQSISSVTALYNAKNGGQYSQRDCSTFAVADTHCAGADFLRAHLMLSPCQTATDNFCIQSLEFLKSDGTREISSLQFEATTKVIPASPSLKTSNGGGVSIWSAPKSPHSGGNGTYMVSAAIDYSVSAQNPIISMDSFNAVVIPMDISTDSGARQARACEQADPNINGNSNVSYGWACADNQPNPKTSARCSQMLDGLCFMNKDFLPNTKISLTMRVDNRVTGWLFGRMAQSQVAVTPIDKSSNMLTVEGTAQSVPTLVGYVKKAELDKYPEIKTEFSSMCSVPGADMTCDKMIVTNFFDGTLGSGRDRFRVFRLFESQMQAYSGSDPDFRQDTNWSFGSTRYAGSTGGAGSCFADKTKLLGLVTTNAPVYESGPPKMTDGSLTYKVAGAHLNADGSLFKGTYDLAIRSDVARCIYGFSDAPIKASISVSSTDGSTSEISTEVVSERDGWMKLRAANFTFSSPTIRIKLSQDNAVKPVASATNTQSESKNENKVATSANAAKKIKLINCVKGKLTRKISGVNPKCPAGFVKK